MLKWLKRAAKCNGVHKSESKVAGFLWTIFSINSLHISRWPFSDAKCSGVDINVVVIEPICFSVKLYCPILSIMYLHKSKCPCSAATWIGNHLLCGLRLYGSNIFKLAVLLQVQNVNWRQGRKWRVGNCPPKFWQNRRRRLVAAAAHTQLYVLLAHPDLGSYLLTPLGDFGF